MCCGKIGHSFTGLKRRKASNTPTQSPILYRSGFEPMKESILAPDKPGYWFDKIVGRLQSQRFQQCLHALCILCSMHDETAATRRPAAPHLGFLLLLWCEDSATLPVRLCVSSAEDACGVTATAVMYFACMHEPL